ncbi:MAG: DUF6048 family protein [Candidatus Saccharibacteria bacterium]
MKILSFTFILFLLAAFSFGQGQPKKKVKPKRTDNYIHMKGLRFGMDVTRPFQDLWTKGNRYGTEFSADMELFPNLFPVFETGYEAMKIKTDYIDYTANGSYSRIGLDYNFLQAEQITDKDILYIGFRYGFTFARQQVDQYRIDSYWGPETGSLGNQPFSAQWGEVLLGIKGEILKNLYMGWTIRGKSKLHSKDTGTPPVYFIPGYGKGEKGFNFDFTYSVYYNIPWDFRKNAGVNKRAKAEAEAKEKEQTKTKVPEKGNTEPAQKAKERVNQPAKVE